MTSRAAGEGDGAGRRMSKSQFQAGEGDACTQGVLNTSAPARTSTYASTTAAFCPLPMYLRQAPRPASAGRQPCAAWKSSDPGNGDLQRFQAPSARA